MKNLISRLMVFGALLSASISLASPALADTWHNYTNDRNHAAREWNRQAHNRGYDNSPWYNTQNVPYYYGQYVDPNAQAWYANQYDHGSQKAQNDADRILRDAQRHNPVR